MSIVPSNVSFPLSSVSVKWTVIAAWTILPPIHGAPSTTIHNRPYQWTILITDPHQPYWPVNHITPWTAVQIQPYYPMNRIALWTILLHESYYLMNQDVPRVTCRLMNNNTQWTIWPHEPYCPMNYNTPWTTIHIEPYYPMNRIALWTVLPRKQYCPMNWTGHIYITTWKIFPR